MLINCLHLLAKQATNNNNNNNSFLVLPGIPPLRAQWYPANPTVHIGLPIYDYSYTACTLLVRTSIPDRAQVSHRTVINLFREDDKKTLGYDGGDRKGGEMGEGGREGRGVI